MLVRIDAESPHSADEELAALVGRQVFWTESTHRNGTEIFGEGEDANFIYRVTTGAVRTYKLLSDGRRQINSFHLPGDVFGLEDGQSHRFTAEAVVASTLRRIRRSSVFDGSTCCEVDTAIKLVGLIGRNLRHAENHMLLLGRKTAVERVVAFILEMDERLDHPRKMNFPMNRQDIADYLGLTLETVSRAFSLLRDQGLLRFNGHANREVELLDREALAKFAA